MRSREKKKTPRYNVHCNICGFILQTDRDIAQFVAGMHMRDPQYAGHVTKVLGASDKKVTDND